MRRFVTGMSFSLIFILHSSCSDDAPRVIDLDGLNRPVVTITSPSDGDTLYSASADISVTVQDWSEIASVTFYVDDEIVDEDDAAPFAGVWHAGYWNTGQPYSLSAVAVDAQGNAGYSDTLVLYVSPEARIVPQPFQPADSLYIAAFTTLTFKCAPCPGATEYTIEWHCRDCSCSGEWCGTVYMTSSTNEVFALVRINSTLEDLEIDWRVLARWSLDHISEWSEKRLLRIHATP